MIADRPSYFVVARRLGRETPMLFWDELPRQPIRDLVYVVRLDSLPGGDRMVNTPLRDLFAVYQRLKRIGKLPPRWEPPPQKKADEPAKPLLGHREVFVRRHLPDAPAEPWPDPERLGKARAP